MSPRCVFLTFGGPSPGYRARVTTLCDQATRTGVFDAVHGFTDLDLKDDPAFWPQHGAFLASHPRGYGHWLWKPYLIQRTLATLQDEDILVYLDAGCTINLDGAARLAEYLAMVRTNPFGLLAFQLKGCTERQYTKRAVLDAMGLPDHRRDTDQYLGGILLMRRTSHTLQFVRNWFEMGTAFSYGWIDDGRGPDEDPRFRDHRHDQSLYSVLIKTYAANPDAPPVCTLPDETYFFPDWNTGRAYPFWATRIRQ